MKKLSAIFLVLSIILQLCTAPPVTKNKEPEEDNKENDGKDKEVGLVSKLTLILSNHRMSKYCFETRTLYIVL